MDTADYIERYLAALRVPESSAEAVIHYNLAPSGELDVGERNRFSQFNEEERRAVLEFVQYRAALPEYAGDQAYLEEARNFWGGAVASDSSDR